MAEIKKRGKNKYFVRIFIGRKVAGKSPYLDKVIHGDKKAAIKYAVTTEAKRDLGLLNEPEPTDPTLKTYLKEWFEQFKKPSVRHRTAASYLDVLDLYIVPRLGAKRLSELSTRTIQEAYNQLADDGYSPRTVSYAHTLLREALDQAARDGAIQANPALSTRRPARRRPKIFVFSPEEADRFMKVSEADRHSTLFWLALATGLRPEEYLALTWPDLNLTDCTVSVSRTVYFPKGGGWSFEEIKTESSRRTVEFNKKLAMALAEHKRRQFEFRLKAGSKYLNNSLVFAGRGGEALNLRNVSRRHLQPILESAKIGGPASLYRLRHSFVTLSLLAGVDPKTVSEAAGHGSVAFTLDNYAHVLPKMRKDAARKIGKLLFRSV